ncbi:MAG TPA: DUF3467 domain-containing protein [Pyrinomonadaceae bacterium]|nr:DUF3467 domain-containing protein [Pyrinomonadaceae bacterium]
MAEDKEEKDFDETLTLNIIHRFPEGVGLTFSDNIAVQHTPSEFTITFAQVRQPLLQQLSDYEKIETIDAEVVARIVLTPTKMLEFIKSLQDNWKIYQRRMKALMEAKNVGVGTTSITTQDQPSEN